MTDWEKAKLAYVYGNLSYQEVADKFGVSRRSVERHASKGDWTGLKKAHDGELAEACRQDSIKLGTKFIEELNADAWKTHRKIALILDMAEPLSPRDIRSLTGAICELRMLADDKENDKELVIRFVDYEGTDAAEADGKTEAVP